MGFLSVILTIIFVMWLLGLIGRIFLRSWILKQQRKFTQAQGAYQQQQGFSNSRAQQQRPEGDIKVETLKSNDNTAEHKAVPRSVGDYVEFEEETS